VTLPPDDRHAGTVTSRRDLDGLALAEVDYSPGLSLPVHAHPDPYLCVTVRGTYRERMEGRLRSCTAGTVVFRPAGEPHASDFRSTGTRCLLVRFAPVWLSRAADSGAPLPPRSVECRRDPAGRLGKRLHREFLAGDPPSRLGVEGIALALLADLLRIPLAREAGTPRWWDRVLERIHAGYRTPPGLAALAREAGIHPVHLAREFRRRTGTTVAGYLRELRVEEALRRLRSTEAPLAEVADESGFADQSHLTRSVKAATGLTPRAYRNRFRRR
jgi:AraC family transcriptional regulator